MNIMILSLDLLFVSKLAFLDSLVVSLIAGSPEYFGALLFSSKTIS